MLEVEVAVVGAGVMGSSAAYHIAKNGQSVALVEQFDFGHAKGSSHGDGRIFRISYPQTHLVMMMKRGIKLWDQLEKDADTKVTKLTGMVDIGTSDSQYLKELEETYHTLSINHDLLDFEQCNERFPHFNLPNNARAIYLKDAGVVFADKAVAAFQKAAQNFGAHLIERDGVVGISKDASGSFILKTQSGRAIISKKLILTCGSWTNKALQFADLSTLPLKATHEQVSYFKPKSDTNIDFSADGMPVYHIVGFTEDHSMYGIPNVEGGVDGVKLAVHGGGPVIDPDAERIDDLHQGMFEESNIIRKKFFPALSDEHSFVRCIYTVPEDHKFVIGSHPEDRNVIIGAGFCGEGFKFASVVGEVLKDVANAASPSVDVSMWKVDRFFNKSKL